MVLPQAMHHDCVEPRGVGPEPAHCTGRITIAAACRSQSIDLGWKGEGRQFFGGVQRYHLGSPARTVHLQHDLLEAFLRPAASCVQRPDDMQQVQARSLRETGSTNRL